MKIMYDSKDRQKLILLKGALINEGHDVHELVDLLNIEVEDVLEKFEDKLLEQQEMFIDFTGFVFDDNEEDWENGEYTEGWHVEEREDF
jgi:hypothetical protein